jgi:hypothetical protein
MIRHYCDGCGKEITEDNAAVGGPIHCSDRLGTEITKRGVKLRVEIITSMDGTANAGHFCRHCVLDALYKLDDRPKLRRAS